MIYSQEIIGENIVEVLIVKYQETIKNALQNDKFTFSHIQGGNNKVAEFLCPSEAVVSVKNSFRTQSHNLGTILEIQRIKTEVRFWILT